MSSDPVLTAIDLHDARKVQCWCCATSATSPSAWSNWETPRGAPLPRVCSLVHQRAWEIEDERRGGPAAVARDEFRNLRAEAIRRGWHHNKFIGGKLRWLGKYLP